MYTQILVPVDGSTTSQHGLSEAIRLARLTGARLRLIHVIDDLTIALSVDAYAGYAIDWMKSVRDSGEELLQKARALATAAGLEVETVLREDAAHSVHELVVSEAAAWPADLIVIGTHGRRGFNRLLLGSSAENIIRRSPVPVLLVRSPEPAMAQDDSIAAASEQTVHVSLPSAALKIE